MANIVLNDILYELREENNRLFNENKRFNEIYYLLEKYRKFSLDLQNICVCYQKSNNDLIIKSLEKEYQRIAIQKQVIKSEIFEINYEKAVNESQDNGPKNTTEDMDTDCEVSDGNDTQISDGFDEEKESKDETNKEYNCSECQSKFKHKLSLNFHIKRTHNKRNAYKCLECSQSFHTSAHLKIHRESVHRRSTPLKFENKESHKKFVSDLLKRQKLNHSLVGNPFECKECHKIFKNSETLRTHMNRVHFEEQVTCDEDGCGQTFKNSISLKEHKKAVHIDHKLSCDWPGCGRTYKQMKTLRLHKLTHTNEKVIPCKVEGCPKTFCNSRKMRDHLNWHKKPHPCQWPGCDKGFYNWEQLDGHINKEHKNVRPFNCSFEGCDKAFHSNSLRVGHEKYVHINPKPQSIESIAFKCKECEYEAKTQRALTAHITKSHSTAEPTIKCDFEGCSKMFVSDYSLKVHYKRLHLSETFTCDWPGCQFTTPLKEVMRDHKLYHIGKRDFKCDFEGCDKCFVTKNNLRQHRMTHLKRYVCSWPECGQRFSDPPALTSHMNTHLNLRPFKCSIDGCNKDFKIDKQLKLHIRTVHKTRKQ